MPIIALTIWGIQGILMVFDEFYFHHRRGLGKWERIGHPIDTFFFILPFIFCLFSNNSNIFIFLSVISTLIITKDEWVHAEESSAIENWLHALLFMIHPVSLYCLYTVWLDQQFDFIKIQAAIIFAFFLYQIIYWNFIKEKRETSS